MNTPTSNTYNDSATGAYKVNSLIIHPQADPMAGEVTWDAPRSLWNGGMLLTTLVLGPIYFSWDAFVLFIVLLEITMCTGHSVGFHRRLIHRTFQCPKWLERVLVWSGTLVGMQGPFWVIQSHDFRDWAQRQPNCHPFLKHGHGLLKDGWWNLHCRLKLKQPPAFNPGPGIGDDRFYQFLQLTWMLQQLPLAIIFFAIGGMPWLVWGICVRVCAGVSMHWFIGYICHTHGPQSWLVNNGAVQAHNVPWAAIPSMGESWHNNHHAFPASARHGLYPGQLDIGFHFIQLLEYVGLAWNVQTPATLPPRNGITPLTADATTAYTSNTAKDRISNDSQNLLIEHMGESFYRLAPLLQRFHTGKKRLTGSCCVQRGNFLARCICIVFRFPKQNEHVALSVDCEHTSNVMMWDRNFNGLRMKSTFSKRNQFLVEHLHGLSMSFEAIEKDGALHYQFQHCYLLGIRLPTWLTPNITAYEEVSDGEYCFLVDVSFPLIGKVIAYWGRMRIHDLECGSLSL